MRLITITEVPDSLAEEWLHYMRSFGDTHADCKFEVSTDARLTMDEMKRLLKIDPNLTFEQMLRNQSGWDDD